MNNDKRKKNTNHKIGSVPTAKVVKLPMQSQVADLGSHLGMKALQALIMHGFDGIHE